MKKKKEDIYLALEDTVKIFLYYYVAVNLQMHSTMKYNVCCF